MAQTSSAVPRHAGRASRVPCGIVLAAIMFTAQSAAAAWSLPACWRSFWNRSPAAVSPNSSNTLPPAVVLPPVPVAAATTAGSKSHPVQPSTRRAPRESKAVAWSQQRRMPRYGLGELPVVDGERPLVVFVHGLNSRPEDLRHWVDSAKRAGFPCASFRYPNDQAIVKSAQLLSRELERLHRWTPVDVYLVTHSMGGLVARAAIEDDQLDPSNVRRLLMVAPPNQGSNLARYACSLDLYEFMVSHQRRRESGWIAGGISDGLSEATRDLEPGSRFLRVLNARPRNPNVKYSIFLGTLAPLEGDELHWVAAATERTKRHCSWMRCLDRQYVQHFQENDEIFAGQGDGFVSINRGRLDGVDDIVMGHFTHCGILGPTTDAELVRVRAELMARLEP